MRPQRSYRDYLDDILRAIGEILSFVEDMDFETFAQTEEQTSP